MKATEAAQQKAQSDSLLQATQLFQQAKQQSLQNQLSVMQYKAGLAERGLVPDNNQPGGFRYDPTLTSPLANILTATKLQADAKTAGNKSIYDMAGGVLSGLTNGGQMQIPQAPAIASGSPLGQAIAPSVIAPNSGASNSPLTVTGQTSQTDPITGLTTGTTTSTNIPAKVAEAKATDLGKEQTAAQIGSSRDTAQMQMIAQGLKNLNNIHKELSDKGAAGNSLANFVANNYQNIPNKDFQNKLVPPDTQKLIGKFISARNESLVKIQPILSQQFGQAGTSRIMESLVNLSKGEFGDLGTPHAQFEGQAEGTLGSFYRFKLASDKYLQGLKEAGQPIPKDENAVAQGIYSNMADLTPEQNKQLKSLVSSTLGGSTKKAPPLGATHYSASTDKYYNAQGQEVN